MKSARFPSGLVAAVFLLSAATALGQRVQFPTRLPATDAVRLAEAPVWEPTPKRKPSAEAASLSKTAALRKAEPAPQVASNQVEIIDPAYVTVPDSVGVPEVMFSDPCFPPTTIVPCVPEVYRSDYGWQFFGDFLWLQARSAEVAYAAAFNGPVVPPPPPPVQIRPIATVDPGSAPGFRVGFSRLLNFPVRLGATYTRYESNSSHDISIAAPDVIRSLVIHPGTAAADADFLSARAGIGVDFDLIDIDYRGTFVRDNHYTLEYLIGLRYAMLQQDFHATFRNTTTIEQVGAEVAFDGGGIRLGLEGERRASRFGLLVYGRAAASFISGRFRSDYVQNDNIFGTVVDTGWKADRIVPILDLELGLGWTDSRERLRLAIGYALSAWYNTVMLDEFIDAVQTNSFLALSDTLTFDGLVARAEVRF